MTGILSIYALAMLTQYDEPPRSAVVGAVFPIAEKDALEEIEERAAAAEMSIDRFGDSDTWSATRSLLLPRTQVTTTRQVVPFYTLDFDIPDGRGGVLYPRGFTFNPLEYAALPGRIIIVHEEHLAWARSLATDRDMILLSGGNALKASNSGGDSIFILEEQLAARLDVSSAPVVVSQRGAQLLLHEYAYHEIDEKNAETGGGVDPS